MPRLSIITTVLHADNKLLDSIESIRPRLDAEHLVSVAGDFDQATRLVQNLGEKRPILIAAPRSSISEGFNVCVREAKGEFIWVLNAGDREINIDPLIEALEADPTLDFAYGDVRCGPALIRSKPAPITKSACLWHGMGFCHGAVVVRRSFHDRYGLYPLDYKVCMDAEVFIRAILQGARMTRVNSCVAEIEPGGNSGNPNTRIPDLYRIMSSHFPPPVPLLLATKWYVASQLGAFAARWRK